MKLNNFTFAQKIIISVWVLCIGLALSMSMGSEFFWVLAMTTVTFILFKVWAKKE
ncbi:MAG: hypothetical protein Q7R43_00345 [Candidatus Daviesbacteria bacterium]|nr:hypothetical protein [Candidatus Daviesbacteria bacterium]